ncbi:hypothetical protein [Terrisporobacter muris]|uniref:Uncharacterized protein n=1 Tax=Terrisporobacter muris TaxID=2963284 RepID=A0A9X2S0F2_9FIRM|nr:hypothetical protein [Terrisporobacter muris]MCR1821714.1 hypothetical protein [Terrisporobacter muris]
MKLRKTVDDEILKDEALVALTREYFDRKNAEESKESEESKETKSKANKKDK